jgi:hypothetical protein
MQRMKEGSMRRAALVHGLLVAWVMWAGDLGFSAGDVVYHRRDGTFREEDYPDMGAERACWSVAEMLQSRFDAALFFCLPEGAVMKKRPPVDEGSPDAPGTPL